VQKRLNRLICRLGCGLGWDKGLGSRQVVPIRVGNFYPRVVLTMVKTPIKTGLGKNPKNPHQLGKIVQN